MFSKRFLHGVIVVLSGFLIFTYYRLCNSSVHAASNGSSPTVYERPLCYLDKLSYSEGAIVKRKDTALQCVAVKVDWISAPVN